LASVPLADRPLGPFPPEPAGTRRADQQAHQPRDVL